MVRWWGVVNLDEKGWCERMGRFGEARARVRYVGFGWCPVVGGTKSMRAEVGWWRGEGCRCGGVGEGGRFGEKGFYNTPPRSLTSFARSAGCGRGVGDLQMAVVRVDVRAKRARRFWGLWEVEMRNLGCRGGYGTNKEGGFRIWKVVCGGLCDDGGWR